MKDSITIRVKDVTDLKHAAQMLLSSFPDHRIFTFSGNLGSGKTTFISAIVSLMHAQDQVSSPTYSIVNEYISDQGLIYHIDLYRLETLEEALNIGMEEYLYNGKFCFVEWPELIATLLPRPYVHVDIQRIAEHERTMHFTEKMKP